MLRSGCFCLVDLIAASCLALSYVALRLSSDIVLLPSDIMFVKHNGVIREIFMLDKINALKPKHVAYIFAVVSLVVFFTGLKGGFQGDDRYQIVNNTPVHSISHIAQLFGSGTFYNGQHLTGIYYRPMMSSTFSLIYAIFGAHPIAYHLVQLVLFTASAFLLYLVFRKFIGQALSLFLALLFLVHPINSQAVFAIPSMQDALFMLFGLLGLWILMTYKSFRSQFLAAFCLFLALLSKETAVIFVFIALLYLFLFERKRLYKFILILIVPFAIYLALKLNAVGLSAKQNGAPIDNLGLAGRLINAPSILLFFFAKLIFPWKLATGYYWVHNKVSFLHFFLPLLLDVIVVGIFVYLGIRVRRKLPNASFLAYIFFAVLAVVSVLPYLQIVPLDMTVCEDWFVPAVAGVLGMAGIATTSFKLRIDKRWPILLGVLIIALMGVRTAVRGTNYQTQYKLAVHDVSASKEDYSAMNNIAEGLTSQGKYRQAALYAKQSINIYPAISNYNNLGVALQDAGEYTQAEQAYNTALKYGSLSEIYENLGQIQLAYGVPPANFQFFQKAINTYPQDFKLWLYIAILEGSSNNKAAAKVAITNAVKYSPVPAVIYNDIMKDQPFTVPILGKVLLVQ